MNTNLEALIVKQILAIAEQATTFACMTHRERNVTESFLDASLLQNILEDAGVYGVAGGVWYDNNVKRVIDMLDHLEHVCATEDTGSGEAFATASYLTELVEKLQTRYNFNY